MSGHRGGCAVGGVVHFRKEREASGAAEPVASVVEVTFAPVHHAMPIAAEFGGVLLKNVVSGVQFIEAVKDGAADEGELGGIFDRFPARERGVIHGAELIG